jgi:hypothetical protein
MEEVGVVVRVVGVVIGVVGVVVGVIVTVIGGVDVVVLTGISTKLAAIVWLAVTLVNV